MNNILNSRVKRLIKDDLLEYGGYLLIFLGIGIVMAVLNVLFGNFAMRIHSSIADFISIMIGLLSFGAATFIMAMMGITAGCELPQHVRAGVARKEYFIAMTVVAVIVGLSIAPLMLLVNVIINLFVDSEGLFYNAVHIGGGEILTLAMHFLIYFALFLACFFITVFWQRVGWKIALAIMIPFFMISNSIIINFVFLNIFNSNSDNYEFYVYWNSQDGISSSMSKFFNITNGLLSVTTLVMIALLGIGTYILIKSVPVKIK